MGNIYAMAQTPDGYPWFGTGIRLVSLWWGSQHSMATARGSRAPWQKHQQPARHARRHRCSRRMQGASNKTC